MDTGKLELVIAHENTNQKVMVCVDCKTQFYTKDVKVSCNGYMITLCPWCRPNSKPWQHGRGA